MKQDVDIATPSRGLPHAAEVSACRALCPRHLSFLVGVSPSDAVGLACLPGGYTVWFCHKLIDKHSISVHEREVAQVLSVSPMSGQSISEEAQRAGANSKDRRRVGRLKI